MTPKEKAIELIKKFSSFAHDEFGYEKINNYKSKQCALIAVDEIYNEIDDNYDTLHSSDRKQYWQDVKSEIEKL
jgi:hypothetical protein